MSSAVTIEQWNKSELKKKLKYGLNVIGYFYLYTYIDIAKYVTKYNRPISVIYANSAALCDGPLHFTHQTAILQQ